MSTAYFQMLDSDNCPFVIRLEDDALIAHARELVSGATNRQPHVQGTVVTSPADYNPGWRYHLDPASIKFFDMALEVCDAASTYVEKHLDEIGGAFLPKSHWCPWASRLTAEVTDLAVRMAQPKPPTVSLKDAFDMYQKQSDSVHKLWGYLSVVSIAVLGFTIGSEKVNWTTSAYLFIGLAYLMFAGSNLWVLRRSQQELGRISDGLAASAEKTGGDAQKFIVASVEADRVTLFHAASILVVLGAIWFSWYQHCKLGTTCGGPAVLAAAGAASAASAPASAGQTRP